MRDMEERGKPTIRYQLMAVARDVLTISAVLSVIGTLFWFVSRPYIEPFLDLPTKVAEINARLGPITQPHLVEFHGHGMIVSDDEVYRPGGQIRILYNLRRNADCATELEYSFVNVDTGSIISTGTGRAVQAPVTEDYTYFLLSLTVPQNLGPGRYAYFPRITPLNCGIYRPYRGALTEIFRVGA